MKNVGCRSRRKPPLSFAEDENDLTCFEHKINLLKPFSFVLCSVVVLGVFGSLSSILHLTVIFSQTKLQPNVYSLFSNVMCISVSLLH